MKNQNSKANDLFLLMFTLSQITLKEKIVDFFLEAIREIWPEMIITYHASKHINEENIIEIFSSDSHFGIFHIQNITILEKEDLDLIHNAVVLLGVILKKNEQDSLLADEKLHLEKMVDEKTAALQEGEEELLRSEQEFRSLAEAMPQIVWITRPDGWNIYFNQQWVDYTGLTMEESHGHGWNIPFHPDDRERAWEAWKNATQNDAVYSLECRLRRADGIYRWWLIRGVPFRNETGEILKWFGTCTDIEDLKETESKLRQSEFNLAEAERIGNSGSWDYDVASDKAVWSENMFRIFDVNPEIPKELVFKYFVENLVHPEDRFHVFEVFQNALNGKGLFDLEYRIVKRNGELRIIHAIAESRYDESGRIYRLIGKVEDITERKLSEEEFRESENKFRKLLESTPLPICHVDQAGVIMFRNERFIKLFGYEEKEVPTLAEWWIKAYPDEKYREWVVKNWDAAVARAAETGTDIQSEEYQVTCNDGRVLEIIISGTTFKDTFLATFIDFTERKQFEKDLIIAMEKAEASNRLKTAFMNNISHEIRTPLNGILGFSQLMIQPGISLAEKEHYYSLVKASSSRLINTITDYMDISMIASDTLELNLTSFDSKTLMVQLKDEFLPMVNRKHLDFDLILQENDPPLFIHTDQDLLFKALSHLLDNAVKFTEKGKVTLRISATADAIEFSVRDTGIGISQEAQARIFNTFVQEVSSTTRGHEGSGLGLSICRGIIRLLNGEIRIESKKGLGSTFFVTIPRQTIQPDNTSEMLDLQNNILKEHPVILIAEDDESNVLYLEALLRKTGIKLLIAVNGEEAVNFCKDHPEISLVLMDIKMPVMDGMEATRKIKSFRKNLPVIAVTAYAMSGDEKRFHEAGCTDYLPKPIKKEDLMTKLKRYGLENE